MLAMFLILFLLLFWSWVWHSLKTGHSFWMIGSSFVIVSLIFCSSLTWTMANVKVCEPPAQNALRSVGTDKWSFPKYLSLCILLSNIRVWAPSFTTTGTPKPASLTFESIFPYVSSRFSYDSRCLIDESSSRVLAGVFTRISFLPIKILSVIV